MLELTPGKLYRTKTQVFLFYRNHTQSYESTSIRPGEIVLLIKKSEPDPKNLNETRGGYWFYNGKILINSVGTNKEPDMYFELLEGQEQEIK